MEKLNRSKIVVGILASISTIVTIIAWLWKLKYKKQIGAGILVFISIISIGLWIWFANIPTFQDSEKSFEQIEGTFSSITKGDLKQ